MHRLTPLLDPRSIAVAGVSERPNSFGLRLAQSVLSGNFAGQIDFINPRHDTVLGKPCRKGFSHLAQAPDLAILGLGASNIEHALIDAVEAGAKSAVIFDACFGAASNGSPLVSRLKAIAEEHGIPICGGSGMGLFNVTTGCVASFFSAEALRPGGISLISHSGAVLTTLSMNDPRYRFDLLISPGQEIGATLDEYIDYAQSREETKVVAVFMETARDPEAFRRSLTNAAKRGVPVVVCKVGRSEESARMAKSHTGALTGSQAAYDAVFEECGAIRVQTVDELMNVAALLSLGRIPGEGGAALITDSGGLRELAMDLAAENGVNLARYSQQTLASLRDVLPEKLEPSNPLDCAADLTEDFAKPFKDSFAILSAAEEVSMIGLEVEIKDHFVYEGELEDFALGMAKRTDKLCFFYSSFSRASNTRFGDRLLENGVPCINGIGEVLNAVTKVQYWSSRRRRAEGDIPCLKDDASTVSKLKKWASSGSIGEHEALKILSDFSIPTIESEVHETLDAIVNAGQRIGYPIALKTAVEGITHKSDVGGVVLNITDREELEQSYQRLASSLGKRVIVQAMAPRGVELAFGCVNDSDFGPLVMVSAGGTLVEHLGGRQYALAPFGEETAMNLIDRLPTAKLLDGVRGIEPVDKRAAAKALSDFSVMCASLKDGLEEVDVNPVIVFSKGVLAVDALIIPRA
jgi:acyl-CoA synthetase (NDP forming)